MTKPEKIILGSMAIWKLGGLYHREDGPALEYSNGSNVWYRYGKLHRDDGPAVVWCNNGIAWYLFDQEFTEEKFKQITYFS